VRKNVRRRFWVEIALASTTSFLTLLTLLLPDWIEFLSSWDPDRHDGSLERLIVAGLCLLTVTIFTLAAMEWRRAPVSHSARSHC
jgi:hypothetical protein